ncbi:hypothetical protein [Allorhizocola rhizosphaerae]|uniref:hypothetical protein n=1 Tax=Allorhizocola rhizosphaerae TaxID=1872709 RepID=UPI0013C3539E|nr:hypothetical protein [Allorhizocola rhizosphaerae]
MATELIKTGFTTALDTRPTTEEWDDRVIAYGQDYMTLARPNCATGSPATSWCCSRTWNRRGCGASPPAR